jgi:hypothetical protein
MEISVSKAEMTSMSVRMFLCEVVARTKSRRPYMSAWPYDD